MVSPTSRMLKQIMVNGTRLNALIDTGSQITVIREDVYNKVKSSQLNGNIICLTGFGKNEVFSLDYTEMIIEIDFERYLCMIHVPNEATNVSIIIGSDFLAMTEMTVNNDGITIRKAKPTEFLAQIDVIEKRLPLDIGSTDLKIRKEVKTMVETYQLNKCKSTEVIMRVISKDEKPIFHKPRRLPTPEREIIKKQVTE